MAKNKNQHYVPHFYLKRFSSEGKSINLWNFPNQRKVLSANLKNQCSENYFYGKELDIETALGDIEDKAAHVFRLIDQNGYPPPHGSDEYFDLVLYVLMQYGRTAYSADALNEMHDKIAKHLISPKAEAEGIDLSELTVHIKDVARYSLGVTAQMYPFLLDLDCVLLSNATNIEFVTSDNPVVLYNQLFAFRKSGGNTGFASKGLQIFVPICPSKILLFYDPAVYNVGTKTNYVVRIIQSRDIFEINTLQMCSARENIYFRNVGFNAEALHRKAAPFRRKQKSNMDIHPVQETENRRQEIIATSREEIRTNLTLTFVRLTKSAKSWRDNFRKLKMQPAVVARNQQLRNDHCEFREKVRTQEYQEEDFSKFLEQKYG